MCHITFEGQWMLICALTGSVGNRPKNSSNIKTQDSLGGCCGWPSPPWSPAAPLQAKKLHHSPWSWWRAQGTPSGQVVHGMWATASSCWKLHPCWRTHAWLHRTFHGLTRGEKSPVIFHPGIVAPAKHIAFPTEQLFYESIIPKTEPQIWRCLKMRSPFSPIKYPCLAKKWNLILRRTHNRCWS